MNKLAVTIVFIILSLEVQASVATELYSDSTAWGEFILNVEGGDKQSIVKAIELRKNADAGALSEINDALFAALKHEPVLILASYKQACYGRADPLPTYREAVKEVEEIIGVVSKIDTEAAKECVNILMKSKAGLLLYYEVNTDGI
jgi:hypothetical protein